MYSYLRNLNKENGLNLSSYKIFIVYFMCTLNASKNRQSKIKNPPAWGMIMPGGGIAHGGREGALISWAFA